MPKSKEQKRREAVERLERDRIPSWMEQGISPQGRSDLFARRHSEAARLREKFGIK
jgi:hypothetical protein